jgi:hypothetical protein
MAGIQEILIISIPKTRRVFQRLLVMHAFGIRLAFAVQPAPPDGPSIIIGRGLYWRDSRDDSAIHLLRQRFIRMLLDAAAKEKGCNELRVILSKIRNGMA